MESSTTQTSGPEWRKENISSPPLAQLAAEAEKISEEPTNELKKISEKMWGRISEALLNLRLQGNEKEQKRFQNRIQELLEGNEKFRAKAHEWRNIFNLYNGFEASKEVIQADFKTPKSKAVVKKLTELIYAIKSSFEHLQKILQDIPKFESIEIRNFDKKSMKDISKKIREPLLHALSKTDDDKKSINCFDLITKYEEEVSNIEKNITSDSLLLFKETLKN